MFKLFHFLHDESSANWEFLQLTDKETYFEATWRVTCPCGAIKHRSRAYAKPDELSQRLHELYAREPGRIDEMKANGSYYIICGHTANSAIRAAKQSKGDNYHI